MRKIDICIVFVMLIALGSVISCSDDESTKTETSLRTGAQTLTQPTLIANGIELPSGTKWNFTDDSHSGVEFELPRDYKFLMYNKKSGKAYISEVGAGYSCTCSGENTCTTIYNEDVGYGCLHSTCTGTCKGKNSLSFSLTSIEGVLYMKNDKIDSNSKVKASLSEKGQELIFELEEFRSEFKEVNEILYKHFSKPDLESNSLENVLKTEKYVMAKSFLYGFEFAMVIPNDPNLKNLIPSLEVSNEPTSCSCSGDGNSCNFEKKGAFGYVAYYCNGCTTCTMN